MPASFRTFNSPGGQTVNGVAYLFDADSGIFRPVYKSDLASSVSISGLSLDSTTTNQLLSGISGLLGANLNDPAYVTGQVGITNTAPIPISGVVVAGVSNPIGVTGVRNDVNPTYSGNGLYNYNFLPVGGRAVNVSGVGLSSGYQTGDYTILNFDRNNGSVLVTQGCLDYTQDNVTIVQSGTSTVTTPIVTGLASTLAANSNRIFAQVSNYSTGALMIRLGATNPTTGANHIILQGGTAWDDGKGGVWSSDKYRGAISCSGVDFTVPMKYTVWEL